MLRALIETVRSPERTPRLMAASLLIAVGLGFVPLDAGAEALAEGSSVRIRSNAIEAGWHLGRIKRDARQCWTVQLDRPTQHGYTQVSLIVVNALQLGKTGAWTAINARQALANAPAHCFEEGAD